VSKQVKIGSELKPDIIDEVIANWQSLLDLMTRIANVPSGLIMKLNEDTIEVFLTSKTDGNPYEAGEKAKLIYGLYCETVIGTQNKLLVPDATKSSVWKDDNPDVDLRMISYLGYPINWPDGEVFGTICILDDKENHYTQTVEDLIYKVKQNLETDLALLVSQQKLEENNLQLKELDSIKDKFFSIIAHDLRSPFNSFLGFTKMLAEDLPTMTLEQIQKIADSMRKSATNLYSLLENLLEWSFLQRGVTTFSPVSFLLMPKLSESLSSIIELASKKEIGIDFNIPENLTVYADDNMLWSIIRNLVSNAVKFTPNGGKVTITAKPIPGDMVEVSIKDTGIGMNPEMVENLFKLDIDTSRKGTENEPSTGLGLILCKEFVEKHGGRLRVESEEGTGSTFHFTLPAKAGA